MSFNRVAEMSYRTWLDGAETLQSFTEKLPLTSTTMIVAFSALGFQYFAINFYRLAVGTLITGLSYQLMKTSFQDKNQESYFAICVKSIQQTRQFMQEFSQKPSLKSPMAPVVGTVSFAIFSYFAFNFVYRIAMGAICLGVSSALLKAAASQKPKGPVTFFANNVASLLDIANFIKGSTTTTTTATATSEIAPNQDASSSNTPEQPPVD